MTTKCKTAFILTDKEDLKDFKDSYGYVTSEGSLWIPFDFNSMMQVVLHESERSYYIPRMPDDEDRFTLAKNVYVRSQEFLRQLLLDNKVVNETEDSFPLEFFWFSLWSGVYRTISLCDDFLNKHSVEEVVLIKRNKFVNQGGLIINLSAFADLIESFLKSRNVKVTVLEYQECYVKPKTIFYSQRSNLKSILIHMMKFVYWKTLTINKKNYDYILIKPSYDNTINYYKACKYAGNEIFPQVFHGAQMPFLHSWRNWPRFLAAKVSFKYKYSDTGCEVPGSYKSNLYDFDFDFAEIFRDTIIQYLEDIKWMNGYINMFWDNCLEKGKRYLTIFSLPPVHLDSYFLMKKAKEGGGKLACWQHGGLYGYTDHLIQYIEDYKNVDYFLSFGKSNIEYFSKSTGDNHAACVQVGSNIMYAKPTSIRFKDKKLTKTKGLFMPLTAGSFSTPSFIEWRAGLQFSTIKQIIDFFETSTSSGVIVKGLKNHRPHMELQRYIELKEYLRVSYDDSPTNKALSNNPEFLVLDNPSTALLQALAQYKGPVFLMVNQKSLSIRKDALALLKRRVVYSESVDEFKMQLSDFFQTGRLEGVDVEDTSFVDVYLKRFSYQKYDVFLHEATQ